MSRSETRFRWAAGVMALAWLLAAGNANAGAILSLTGTGNLRLETDGAVYFDTGSLDLVELELTAVDRIEIAPEFPAGTPAAGFTPLGPIVTAGTADLVFAGDLYFDALDFAGSLNVVAQAIYVRGDIEATGDIHVYAGEQVVIVGSIATTGGASSCGNGVIVVASGSVEAFDPCAGGPIGNQIPVISLDGPIVVTALVVPEPGAMTLFALGIATLALRRSR